MDQRLARIIAKVLGTGVLNAKETAVAGQRLRHPIMFFRFCSFFRNLNTSDAGYRLLPYHAGSAWSTTPQRSP